MHFGLSTYEPLALYVGAIIAFVLSVCWKPEIGLYYLVPLLPMQTARYWLHAFPLGEKLVDVLLLGVLIGLFIHAKRPIFVSSPLNKCVIAFILLTYFALWKGSFYLNAPLPLSYVDPRFSDWKNYVEMMFLFFAAAAVIRTPKQMGIVITLMCASLLLVNRSYHSTIGDRDFSQYSDSLRDAGALGYAGENGMGAFQAEMAVFLIGIAGFIQRRAFKAALRAVALTSIYCLVFTFSRGGYLGFLVGLLVLGLVKKRTLLFLLLVILIGWQSFVPNAVTQRVLMTYQDGQGLDASAEERVTIWHDAQQVINEDPVLGTGFDTYKFMGRVGPYQDTHNYYVKLLLELGFVGLLTFLWMLASGGKAAWQLFRTASDPLSSAVGGAFFAMLICALVVNFFGDRWSYLQVNGFLWVIFGLVARGLVLSRQRAQADAGREASSGFSPEGRQILLRPEMLTPDASVASFLISPGKGKS